MDKRLVNFMLVSMLIIIGYMQINLLLFGPPPGAVPAEGDGAENVEQLAEANPQDDGEPAENTAVPSSDTGQSIGEQNAGDPAADPIRQAAKREFLTIGSVDPASGYPMLVTFTSQGAAVVRVELSDPRFRNLTDKTAYIGHLALAPEANGALVRVVGAGTPAAVGGVQVDDVITQVGDQPTETPVAVTTELATYKAGDDVRLTVLRNGATQTLTLTSMQRPQEVIRPEPIDNTVDSPNRHQLSYLLTLQQIGHKTPNLNELEFPQLPSLRDTDWQSSINQQDGTTVVEFRFPLGSSDLKKLDLEGSLEVIKRFSLRPNLLNDDTATVEAPNYHFDFNVELVNRGSNPMEVGFRIDGPTGLPLEGWWYSYKTHPTKFTGAGIRDIVWRAAGEGHQVHTNPMITKRITKSPDNPKLVIVDRSDPKNLQYLGVDAQYFNSALIAAPGSDACRLIRVDAMAVADIDEQRANRTDVTFRADSEIRQIPAGSSLVQQFQIFAGPKKPEVLAKYGLDECIVYGWFKWPAQFMAGLLHMLHGVVGNYGVAIILLTVLVRAVMFPIGRQQAQNAKRMQELAPEIKKIKEKFPNEMEKQTKAQQELFRKHNYNPLAGCLPMFLQLPIFIGLYRALSVDIELRQTPLIPGLDWCSNLSGPDMLWRWDSFIPFESITGFTGWLGPYFNILPLISTALFLAHQKMFTPPPTDEQQEMQQKIMRVMTLFIGVMFFKVPAGLCLYLITSSIWALAERMLLPKDPPKTAEQTPLSAKEKPQAIGAVTADNGASRKKTRRRKSRK